MDEQPEGKVILLDKVEEQVMQSLHSAKWVTAQGCRLTYLQYLGPSWWLAMCMQSGLPAAAPWGGWKCGPR